MGTGARKKRAGSGILDPRPAYENVPCGGGIWGLARAPVHRNRDGSTGEGWGVGDNVCFGRPMNDEPKPARRTIRIGLGVLILAFGVRSLYTTLIPSAGMLRPDNAGELAVMLVVGAALTGAGLFLIIQGQWRIKETAQDPKK